MRYQVTINILMAESDKLTKLCTLNNIITLRVGGGQWIIGTHYLLPWTIKPKQESRIPETGTGIINTFIMAEYHTKFLTPNIPRLISIIQCKYT